MIDVMLVDDEPWNREIVKRFGEWDKYDMSIVFEANDGMEAINYMKEHQLQLVITDMKMPGVDGGKLMEYIRQRDPQMQLIVISGYEDFDYARQALRHHAVEYLLKPIEAAALNDALRKCYQYMEQQRAVVDVSIDYMMNAYKQSLEQAIDKLQAEQLDQLLQQIKERCSQEALPAAMKQQLHEELWKLAHKLSVDYGVTLQQEQFDKMSWEEVADQFITLLKQLEEQRKYKSKLNIIDVRNYIDKHVKELITLDDLANMFFVSKEYLSKQFKQELGTSVTDYIIGQRMETAKELVKQGKLSFKEIAEEVGYEDVSYFYRVFRKYFGVAPGEMRKQLEV